MHERFGLPTFGICTDRVDFFTHLIVPVNAETLRSQKPETFPVSSPELLLHRCDQRFISCRGFSCRLEIAEVPAHEVQRPGRIGKIWLYLANLPAKTGLVESNARGTYYPRI